MKYTIYNQGFKTKKEIKEFIRSNFYDKYGDYAEFGADDFLFMLDLLKQHPDAEKKLGCGPKSMWLQKMEMYGKQSRGFWLERHDGSKTDFSYNQCLRPTTSWGEFSNACRTAVYPFIREFKQDFFDNNLGVAYCPIKKIEMFFDTADVDHKPPMMFSTIVQLFLKQIKIDYETLKIAENEDGQIGDRFECEDIADMFIHFHKSICDLQVISKEAHREQTIAGLKKTKDSPLTYEEFVKNEINREQKNGNN